MKAKGVAWLGLRTEKLDETVRFFTDVLGLEVALREEDMVKLQLGDDTEVELFGPGDEDHKFFERAPVVGFLVDDVDKAREEMEQKGVEFIGPVQRWEDSAWSHFKGPNNNVYEITSKG